MNSSTSRPRKVRLDKKGELYWEDYNVIAKTDEEIAEFKKKYGLEKNR